MLKHIAYIFLFLLIVVLLLFYFLGYGFTYQDSQSMKEGWYFYAPISQSLHRGEVVLFRPQKDVEHYMLTRHWIQPRAVMMKHVFALPGDFVCRRGQHVLINHRVVGTIKRTYAPGKPLPKLNLCRFLYHDEYMLMSTRVPNSFDSRYFGPVKRSRIFARVVGYSAERRWI